MNIVQRATNITLNPVSEWGVIEPEVTTPGDLYKTYIIPLSAIPVVCTFIGTTMIGTTLPFIGNFRTPIGVGATTLVMSFLFGLLSIFLISLIIDALAPSFGGQKNSMQALKATAYAFTPAWLAGVLSIIPMLGILSIVASVYSVYVLYKGLPVLMKAPTERAMGYTIVTVICAIVLSIVMGAISASVVGLSALTSGGFNLSNHTPKTEISDAEAGAALEKLTTFAKKMESVQKSAKTDLPSDERSTEAQSTEVTSEAAETQADVVQIDAVNPEKLKTVIPAAIGSATRMSLESEKNSDSGYESSKVVALYTEEVATKTVSVTITDYGNNVNSSNFQWIEGDSDKETEMASVKVHEKSGLVDGRRTHESITSINGQNATSFQYDVLVANRFVIEVSAMNADVAAIKSAIGKVLFEKLEAMKDDGVKK